MLDIGSSELLMIVVIAVVVIGPKDLPRALYKVGQVIGKARAMSRHFRSGIDAMIREAEMEELEKKWAAENRRIMQQNPPAAVEGPVIEGPSEGAMPAQMTALPAQAAESPATGGEAGVAAPLSAPVDGADASMPTLPGLQGAAPADGKGS